MTYDAQYTMPMGTLRFRLQFAQIIILHRK